jgi:hypothetical protein
MLQHTNRIRHEQGNGFVLDIEDVQSVHSVRPRSAHRSRHIRKRRKVRVPAEPASRNGGSER